MFCTNCGAKVEDGALFCTNCGAKIETVADTPAEENINPGTTNTEPVSEPAPSTYSEPAPEPAPSAYSEPAPAYNAQYDQASSGDEAPKKKVGLLIGIIAGVLVLIAAILVCVFVIFKNGDSSSKRNKADTEDTSDDDDDEKESKKKKKKKDKDADDDDDDDDDEDNKKSKKKKKDDEDEPTPAPQIDVEIADYNTFDYKKFDTLTDLSSDSRSALASTESDLTEISWDEEYEIEGSGIVLSITKFDYYEQDAFAYCVTNVLPDTTLDLYGTISVLGSGSDSIGDGYFMADALSPGSQVAGIIFCEGTASGEYKIDCSARASETEEGAWASDWALDTSSSSPYVSYDLYGDTDSSFEVRDIYVFAMDQDGKVLGYGYDYASIMLNAGQHETGQIYVYMDSDRVSEIRNCAMFVKTNLINDEDKYIGSDGTAYYESENGDQVYITDNGDNTCGLYVKVVSDGYEKEYVDPNARMYTSSIDFYNVDTGESVGTISVYSGDCYIYINDSGDKKIPDDSTYELNKGTVSDKDKKSIESKIDKKR
ncbi:MAG: zinc-ribbon domain-containing protein [Lachnospiraceae bacterium]|nr:zinc-ribbon domain-containing protein [Lachnospiraceae bacterium]